MTIPRRFVTEYPERCLSLLEAAEPIARERDLLASFALLAAASVLVIPYERLKGKHPITRERQSLLYQALHGLKKKKWPDAPFWCGQHPGGWRFSRVMGDPNQVSEWANHNGIPSLSAEANDIGNRAAGDIMDVLRNALAHGNIVYLNMHGHETPGTAVDQLGFLSRYEVTDEQKAKAETYRLVVATNEGFLDFVRRWARWLASFPPEHLLTEAA